MLLLLRVLLLILPPSMPSWYIHVTCTMAASISIMLY